MPQTKNEYFVVYQSLKMNKSVLNTEIQKGISSYLGYFDIIRAAFGINCRQFSLS